MSERLVENAVIQSSAPTKQSVLQRLFAVWFDAFVYNQIWEDPRVDLVALELDSASNVLTISSGGCNALNYLIAGPKSVRAVDLNRHHVYLLNLKLAALKYLPSHDKFFAFFGFGRGAEAVRDYEEHIAPNLDPNTRRFWESGLFGGRWVRGRRIDMFRNGGLYNHSRNGYFLRFFHKFAHLLGCRPESVLEAKTTEEQAELYARFVEPFFDSVFIRIVGRLPVTTFGLGIPPQQYAELKRDLNGGSIIDVYRERTRRLAVDFPIGENYFAWQAFARRYDTQKRAAVPEYLKAENYERLKANAGRLSTGIGSVTNEIGCSENGRFDRFVFLDAQDWMSKDVMTELWSAIASNGVPGSRIIFRTAGAASPVETNLPPELRNRFRYDKDLSDSLFKQDRASIYGGFHLYVLK